MMSKSKPLLFLIVVVAIIAFFAATEVKAGTDYPVPALTAPRTCTLEFCEGSLVIEAGPGQSQFPRIVPCPDDITQQCSAWDYRWTYSGGNLSHSFVSVSSDVTIFSTNPSASIENPPARGDTTTGVGRFLWEQRTVRFNNNPSTFKATIITELSSARVASAGAKKGKSLRFCLIQGPGAKFAAPISTTFEFESMLTLCVKKELDSQMAIVNLWYGCFDPDAGETCPEDVYQFYAVPGEPWDWYYYGGGNKNVLSPDTTEVEFKEDIYAICPTGDEVAFMEFFEPSKAYAADCSCPPGISYKSRKKSYCICPPP